MAQPIDPDLEGPAWIWPVRILAIAIALFSSVVAVESLFPTVRRGGAVTIWDISYVVSVLLYAATCVFVSIGGRRDSRTTFLAVALLWGMTVDPQSIAFPWLASLTRWVDAIGAGLGVAALALFATAFPSSPPRLRAIAARIVPFVAALYALLLTPGIMDVIFARLDILRAARFSPEVVGAIVLVFGIASLVATYVRSYGEERRRVAWILTSFTLGAWPWIVYPLAGIDFNEFAPIGNSMSFFIPLGSAYAIVRLHVVDVGFALSRATVFTITIVLLAALFGLAEHMASKAIRSESGLVGFLEDMFFALVLIFVVRAAHGRSERFVERVLFAARHRRLAVLETIARDVDHVEKQEHIGPFVVGRLRDDSGILATLYVRANDDYARTAGDDRHPATISADDPGMVALRSSKLPIRGIASAIPWPQAYPLVVHGRVIGALACSSPGTEEFAPDEDRALIHVAHATAAALTWPNQPSSTA